MNERSAIASQFIFWVGMLVFGLALVSFFISSEWRILMAKAGPAIYTDW